MRLRYALCLLAWLAATPCRAGIVATWLFDEQTQAYPSTILNDSGPHGYIMALGRGAHLAPGLARLEPSPGRWKRASSAISRARSPPSRCGVAGPALLRRRAADGGERQLTGPARPTHAYLYASIGPWSSPRVGAAGWRRVIESAKARAARTTRSRSRWPGPSRFELWNRRQSLAMRFRRPAQRISAWRHLAFVYSVEVAVTARRRLQFAEPARLESLARRRGLLRGRDGRWGARCRTDR